MLKRQQGSASVMILIITLALLSATFTVKQWMHLKRTNYEGQTEKLQISRALELSCDVFFAQRQICVWRTDDNGLQAWLSGWTAIDQPSQVQIAFSSPISLPDRLVLAVDSSYATIDKSTIRKAMHQIGTMLHWSNEQIDRAIHYAQLIDWYHLHFQSNEVVGGWPWMVGTQDESVRGRLEAFDKLPQSLYKDSFATYDSERAKQMVTAIQYAFIWLVEPYELIWRIQERIRMACNCDLRHLMNGSSVMKTNDP
jgi:hypothetical protein